MLSTNIPSLALYWYKITLYLNLIIISLAIKSVQKMNSLVISVMIYIVVRWRKRSGMRKQSMQSKLTARAI